MSCIALSKEAAKPVWAKQLNQLPGLVVNFVYYLVPKDMQAPI